MVRATFAAQSLSALLLLGTTAVLSSCYTQLAGSGDRYGYTGHYREPVVVHSDTIRKPVQQAAAQEAPKPVAKVETKPQVTYDTVMKGDTMFIEERTREAYTSNETQPVNSAETIINNYYGGYEPYDDYWWHVHRPRVIIALTFGYPYSYWYPRHYWHSYYSPWYDYGYYPSWWYGPSYAYYDPWYGPGFYPPLYDAYYPYGGYYGGYRGRHGYGYGHGGYDDGYAGRNTGRVPHYGRFSTGEKHGLVISGNNTAPGTSIKGQSNDGLRLQGVTTAPQGVMQGQATARDVPVHTTVPDGNGNLRAAEPARRTVIIERNPEALQSGAEVDVRNDRNDISPGAQTTAQGGGQPATQSSVPQKRVIVIRRSQGLSGDPSGTVQNGNPNVSSGAAQSPRRTSNNVPSSTGNEARSETRAPAQTETRAPEVRAPESNRTEARTNGSGETRGSGEGRTNERSGEGSGERSGSSGSNDGHRRSR